MSLYNGRFELSMPAEIRQNNGCFELSMPAEIRQNNGRFELSMPAEIRQYIYKKLNVRLIKSVKSFGFLDSYINMFLNVKDEMNCHSDFVPAFVFFLKEIQKQSQFSEYRVRFKDLCEMASQLNGISVKCCSGSEKLSIIKTFSRFVDDTVLESVDRIKYRVLTAITHKFVISDDGNQQLKLDNDVLRSFNSLNREEQLAIFNLCAEYGRSDLEWVAYNLQDLAISDFQKPLILAVESGHVASLKCLVGKYLHTELCDRYLRSFANEALRLAAREGHVEVLKWLHYTFRLTADDSRSVDNEALRCAAENGHVEVLKWLQETFGLTEEEAQVVIMKR